MTPGLLRHRHLLAVVLAAVGLASLIGGCSDDDGGSAEELCSLVGDGRSYEALFAEGFDPTEPDRAVAQLRSAQVDLAALRVAAPSSLHGALDDEARYLAALLDAVSSADPDDPAAVVGAVNALDEERTAAEAAAAELSEFAEENCSTPSTSG